MPQARTIQTNFTAGEFTPRLLGRPDLERYKNGAAELLNVLVLPQGGATKRPGSYYVAPVKTATIGVRLKAFTVSTIAAYVLEFGPGYIRFYRNRALITAAGVPIEVVTPYAAGDLAALRFAQSADVLYITHTSHQPRKLSRIAADSFELTPVTFRNGPYRAENTGNVTVADAASSGSGAGDGSSSGGTGGTDTGGTPDTGGETGQGGAGGGGGGGGGE